MNPLRNAFSKVEKLLLYFGIAGFAVYFFLLPGIHPDAAADYTLNKEEILDRAKGFAFNQGYNINGFTWEVSPERSINLLDTLQALNEGSAIFETIQKPFF